MIRSRGGLTSYVGYGALTLILMYILFLYNATKNGLSQCELTGIQLKEDKQDLLSQLSVCHEHSKRLRTSSDETSDALSKCSTARRETEKSQQRCVEDFRAKKEELNTKELEFSKSERDASILRSKLAIKEEDCSRVEQKSLAEYQQCKDQKQEMETDLQGQLAVKNSKIETLTQDLANLQQQIQQLQQQQQQVQQQAQQQQQLQQQPLQQQPAVAFLPALRQQSANGAANPMPGHQPFVPQFQQADTLGKILNPPVNNNGNAPPLQPLALLQQVAALQPAVENQNLPVAANQNLPVAANQNLPVAANQNLPAAANQNEVVGAAQPGALPQVAQEVKGQQDSNNGQPAGVGPTGVGPDGVGPVENKRGVVAFSETSKPAVNSIIKRSLEKQVEARRALRRPGGGGDYRLQVKGADDKQPANEEKELHDNNHVPDRYQVDKDIEMADGALRADAVKTTLISKQKVGLGRDEVNKDTMDKPPQQPLPLHPFPGDEDNHENTAGNIMKARGNKDQHIGKVLSVHDDASKNAAKNVALVTSPPAKMESIIKPDSKKFSVFDKQVSHNWQQIQPPTAQGSAKEKKLKNADENNAGEVDDEVGPKQQVNDEVGPKQEVDDNGYKVMHKSHEGEGGAVLDRWSQRNVDVEDNAGEIIHRLGVGDVKPQGSLHAPVEDILLGKP